MKLRIAPLVLEGPSITKMSPSTSSMVMIPHKPKSRKSSKLKELTSTTIDSSSYKEKSNKSPKWSKSQEIEISLDFLNILRTLQAPMPSLIKLKNASTSTAGLKKSSTRRANSWRSWRRSWRVWIGASRKLSSMWRRKGISIKPKTFSTRSSSATASLKVANWAKS